MICFIGLKGKYIHYTVYSVRKSYDWTRKKIVKDIIGCAEKVMFRFIGLKGKYIHYTGCAKRVMIRPRRKIVKILYVVPKKVMIRFI